MSNKIIKLSVITLMGAILFGFSPFVAFARTQVNFTTYATDITSTSATLNGRVSVVGGLYTSTWFEYGTNTSFTYSTPRSSFGSGYFTYEYNISGLRPSTAYYFRSVSQNSQGIQFGNTNSFVTDSAGQYNNNYVVNDYQTLTAITQPASSVSSSSVQLNSLIYNQDNLSSNTWFEWGTTSGLGNRTDSIVTGNMPSVKHINTLTGLASNTTYYFRAVAENSSFRNNGPILSFTTNKRQATPTGATTTNEPTPTVDAGESALVANVFGAGSFMPSSILGWLLLIIFILVLIIIGKHLQNQFSKPKENQAHV